MLPKVIERHQPEIEEALERFLRQCHGPEGLTLAMEYSLLARGKRVRPVLVLAAYDLLGRRGPDPMPAACAVEFVHTYSLIHDDLPCMDDDDFRRGRPSCHKKFGEGVALLAGDALLTEAFHLLARSYLDCESGLFARLALELGAACGNGGMVGGQYVDTEMRDSIRSLSDLERMHAMKTGALIRACVRMGAFLGHASSEELSALTLYGERLGLCFQVADDCLDVTANKGELGKTPGKDAAQGKATYVALMGLERAQEYARTLAAEAAAALEGFGTRAAPLQELAMFVANRTH